MNAIIIGTLIPLLGTTLGSACVFLVKNKLNRNFEKFLLGFASGVMIAASIWSLLIPALDIAQSFMKAYWIPASIGFIFGVLFLLLLDHLIPHLHQDSKQAEGPKSSLSESIKLFLAITIHNIPEGMVVGVVLAGAINQHHILTITSALALSIGIAIQNFPEGAILSLPLKAKGYSKKHAFLFGMLSGVVEPVSALLTILFTTFIHPILPYILAFAAGAMIYVVIEELIPDAHSDDHNDFSVIGVTLGFLLMMILDISFG